MSDLAISSLAPFIETGGSVATTALFIWYLYNKNGKSDRALQRVADALDSLHSAQEKHTRVLMNVAKAHRLDGDADSLMTS